VQAQQDTWWYGLVLFPSFVIYAISMVGETNRAPFDLAEAEGEFVGGFHTEYSSLKFALFFLAEYVNIIAVSALATTLFLGGYKAPPGLGFTESWLGGWFTAIWFFLKVLTFFFVFVWLRGTLPRLRYDQFMQFGWKVLIPVSILWILVVATLRVLSLQNAPRIVVIAFASSVVFIIMAVNVGFESAKKKKEQAVVDGDNKEAPKFAVPSLPMEVSTINVSQKVGDNRG
jgi:NADH-quinone oxidoreductase subunit H